MQIRLFDFWNKATWRLWMYFNRIKLFILGVKIGPNSRIRNSFYLKIQDGGSLTIGDNFVLTSAGGINPLGANRKSFIYINSGANIDIGSNVGISNATLWAEKRIQIGNNVNIGANVLILDTDAHSLNYLNRRKLESDANDAVNSEIKIEDDVLIGANSIILKGVTIGVRSIIGAGSVVVGSIPENCIAAGNPCKVIKNIRYNE